MGPVSGCISKALRDTEGHWGTGPTGEGSSLGIAALLAGVALSGCQPSEEEEEAAIPCCRSVRWALVSLPPGFPLQGMLWALVRSSVAKWTFGWEMSSPVLEEVCPEVWPKSYFHTDKFGQGPWYGPQILWSASAKSGEEEEAVVLGDVPESGQEVTAAPKLPGRIRVPVNCPVIIAHTIVFWKEAFFSWARDYWWNALMQPLKSKNNTCK